MRTMIPAVSVVVLASLIGGMAIAIYNNQSALRTTTNPARMSLSLTGSRSDSKNEHEQKLKVEPAWATAFETFAPEEWVRIEDQMQTTGTAAPEVRKNTLAIKRVTSEKSEEPRRVMLTRQLRELQAQRRWIEEEEYSLRFAVLETEPNVR